MCEGLLENGIHGEDVCPRCTIGQLLFFRIILCSSWTTLEQRLLSTHPSISLRIAFIPIMCDPSCTYDQSLATADNEFSSPESSLLFWIYCAPLSSVALNASLLPPFLAVRFPLSAYILPFFARFFSLSFNGLPKQGQYPPQGQPQQQGYGAPPVRIIVLLRLSCRCTDFVDRFIESQMRLHFGVFPQQNRCERFCFPVILVCIRVLCVPHIIVLKLPLSVVALFSCCRCSMALRNKDTALLQYVL